MSAVNLLCHINKSGGEIAVLFNSVEFIVFFIAVSFSYFLLPHRFRWVMLLGASYIFYMWWNPSYALLMLFSTASTYAVALLMEKASTKQKRKVFLALGIAINLAILFIFKYFNFFSGLVDDVFGLFGHSVKPATLSLILPVGISFYTFQALGYSIDVYRGDLPAQHHFGKYALFVSFFPQLVAGPIERSTTLMPQFDEVHTFDYDRAVSGLKLMTWGFFKKIVVADTLAVYVTEVFNAPRSFDGVSLIIASVLFTIQIFCDFSGYSDIAIGTARILGFRLMKNFNHPYFSTSIADFWRNWHISLSTWFRDYVYIPLGGNRCSKFRANMNLVITFLLSGLWHGANLTYVLWGAMHGVFQVVGKLTKNARKKLKHLLRIDRLPHVEKAFSIVITFCLVSYALIIFRSNTIRDALYISWKVFDIDLSLWTVGNLYGTVKALLGSWAEVYRFILTFPVFIALSFADYFRPLGPLVKKQRSPVRFFIYFAAVLYILLMAKSGMADFIYFQF